MTENPKALKIFSPLRIAITIGIGLAVASYMVYQSYDPKVFENINWSWHSTFWMLIALVMMATRDLAYMVRIRILTENKLSWKQSFQTIMLWEFASAITPSVVGGSGVAIYLVNKEGVSTGRSTAVVMITAFLDELFYILMVPIIIFLVGYKKIFQVELPEETMGNLLSKYGVEIIFFVGYGFIVFLTSFILYAIFFKPRGFKWILLKVFGLSFLRKWRFRAAETGDEIIITSSELKGKPFVFWLKAFMATFFSWTARYWVVNFLILAFVMVDDHFLLYARQLVMWVIMLISPTPGSTGVAEIAFSGFLKDFIPQGLGLVAALAFLWRLVSYYLYLFIGAIILPRWVRRTHS